MYLSDVFSQPNISNLRLLQWLKTEMHLHFLHKVINSKGQ